MEEKEKNQTDRNNQMLYILQKETLTLNEACLYLGISHSFMYKLTHKRSIPQYVPSGKLIFFKRTELDEWVLQNKKKTREEIAEEVPQMFKRGRK